MWHEELAVNLMGTLHVVHLLLGSLLERGYGRVVNIVSDSARVGEPNVTLYAAAKAAVGGFSRALAKEVGPSGVTVNCVSLSTTVTPGALSTFTPEQLDRMPRFYPLRGWERRRMRLLPSPISPVTMRGGSPARRSASTEATPSRRSHEAPGLGERGNPSPRGLALPRRRLCTRCDDQCLTWRAA